MFTQNGDRVLWNGVPVVAIEHERNVVIHTESTEGTRTFIECIRDPNFIEAYVLRAAWKACRAYGDIMQVDMSQQNIDRVLASVSIADYQQEIELWMEPYVQDLPLRMQ